MKLIIIIKRNATGGPVRFFVRGHYTRTPHFRLGQRGLNPRFSWWPSRTSGGQSFPSVQVQFKWHMSFGGSFRSTVWTVELNFGRGGFPRFDSTVQQVQRMQSSRRTSLHSAPLPLLRLGSATVELRSSAQFAGSNLQVLGRLNSEVQVSLPRV